MPTSWAIHTYGRRTLKPMQLNGQERRLQQNLIHCNLRQSECRRYISQCWWSLLILFCVRLLGFLHGVNGCGWAHLFPASRKMVTLLCWLELVKWHTPRKYVQHGTPSMRIKVLPKHPNWKRCNHLHLTMDPKLFMASKCVYILLFRFYSSLIFITFCLNKFWFALNKVRIQH